MGSRKKVELFLSVEKVNRSNMLSVLRSFTGSQLLEILEEAAVFHPHILHTVLSIIDEDPSRRKLVVRSLGPKTTSKTLGDFFSKYGPVEEAEVVLDRMTGNSAGFGFVTFKKLESLLLALGEPSKRIEGFVSFATACVGREPYSKMGIGDKDGVREEEEEEDDLKRGIRVENVPEDMKPEALLSWFEKYGEIEEGPWGLDMETGKAKEGVVYLKYRKEESAAAAVAEQCKTVDGFNIACKMDVKENERNSRCGRRSSSGTLLALPLRILFLRMFHYHYFHFRELPSSS